MNLRELLNENSQESKTSIQNSDQDFLDIFGDLKAMDVLNGLMNSDYSFLDQGLPLIKNGLN